METNVMSSITLFDIESIKAVKRNFSSLKTITLEAIDSRGNISLISFHIENDIDIVVEEDV
jgi:hypothetical protein